MKSSKDVGDGLATPQSQWPVSHVKPWPGTHRERESEAAQETPGAAFLEAETKRSCNTWGQLVRLAQDRDAWRALVGGLFFSRGQRQWWVGTHEDIGQQTIISTIFYTQRIQDRGRETTTSNSAASSCHFQGQIMTFDIINFTSSCFCWGHL